MTDNHRMFLFDNLANPTSKNLSKKHIFQFYTVEDERLYLILTGTSLFPNIQFKPSIDLFKSGLIITFEKAPIHTEAGKGEGSSFLICSYEEVEHQDRYNRFENINLELFTHNMLVSLLREIMFIFDKETDRKGIINKFDDLKLIETKNSIIKKYVPLIIPPNLKNNFGSTYESQTFFNEVYNVIVNYLHKEILS
jgi:hypothetical protein